MVALRDGRAELIGLQEMIARLLHGGVKAKQAHVDARQSFPTALIAQLMAPLSNQAAASSSSVFGASASR